MQPAEESAVTPATVKPGMGYPNHREEESPTPVGWQPLFSEEIEHVSRETLPKKTSEAGN